LLQVFDIAEAYSLALSRRIAEQVGDNLKKKKEKRGKKMPTKGKTGSSCPSLRGCGECERRVSILVGVLFCMRSFLSERTRSFSLLFVKRNRARLPPPTHPRGILEAARDKEQYYPAY